MHTASSLLRDFKGRFRSENHDNILDESIAAALEEEDYQEHLKDPTAHTLEQKFLTCHITGNSPEAELENATERLEAARNQFLRAQPKSHVTNISSKPDLQEIIEAIQRQSDQRVSAPSGGQKCLSRLSSMCERVKGYRSMFAILPLESSYCSIFFGMFWSLVEASSQHARIANEVQQTVEQITNLIDTWQRLIGKLDSRSERLTRLVAQLYIELFEFLARVFAKWSKSPLVRLCASFDAGFGERIFGDFRTKLVRIEKWLDLELNVYVLDRLNDVKERQDRADEQNEVFVRHSTNSERMLGQSGKDFLTEFGEAVIYKIQVRTVEGIEVTMMANSRQAAIEAISPPPMTDAPVAQSQSTIAVTMETLEQILVEDSAYVSNLIKRATRYEVDATTKQHLLSWFRGTIHPRIWVQGPYSVCEPSQNTMTAVLLSTVAHKTGIPCVKYFCRITPSKKKSDFQMMTIQLLRSLICQISPMIPKEKVDQLQDLWLELEKLVQDTLELDIAILLFRKIRNLGPEQLILIIDGLQRLEDRSQQEGTQALAQLLRAICVDDSNSEDCEVSDVTVTHSDTPKRITKICFTTNGYVDILGRLSTANVIVKTEYGEEATSKSCAPTEWLDSSKL